MDERPKQTQWYLDDVNQVRIVYINDYDYWAQRKDYKCIIASTIPNVGKELRINREGLIQDANVFHERYIDYLANKQYEYTELETSIIIKL